MTIENEGTAQPADPAVPGEGNGVSEGGDGGNTDKANGVQKRIDQLVAEREQMRQQLAEQQKLTQTLMLETMTRQQQQQQRAPPPPELPSVPQAPEGVDPQLYAAFVKAAEATSQRQMMELERRMAPLVQQTYRSQAQMQIEREAGGNAELAQRAQRRYDAVIAAGYTMSPADAVLYEEGLIAREARSRQTQNRDELGRFNRGANTMTGAGGPINQLTPPAEPPVPSFADQSSDDFNATKAAAYWKDRLKGKK